jgi:hypothetical protein
MNTLGQALAGLAAAVLCAAAWAGPVAPEAFHSFSDLVRLTASAEAAGAAGAMDAAASAEESSSAGASRAPDDGPLQLGRERDQALFVGAPLARAAQTPAARDAQYRFSVTALPRPQGWLLLLSGIAAAAWVARRRLRYPIHG